ncbi:MAG: TetR/AcrR family transcriptional regulator [Clostridiales Family XIII bacterium]|jgi:AcrR family transcriptional regulator|nr:TetR/AcrR family transcriptional regulator [Clostridiales Family XIII bacterium]
MPKPNFFSIREHKRKRILDAAYNEFLSYPYVKASVNRIARDADIAVGSLYQYFEDKDDLYIYILEELLEEALRKLQDSGCDVERYYVELFRTGFDPQSLRKNFWAEQEHFKFFATITDVPVDVKRKFYFNSRNKAIILENYRKMLLKLKDEGKLADHVNIDLTAYLFTTCIFNIVLYCSEKGITDIEELGKLTSNFTLQVMTHGIMAPEE